MALFSKSHPLFKPGLLVATLVGALLLWIVGEAGTWIVVALGEALNLSFHLVWACASLLIAGLICEFGG